MYAALSFYFYHSSFIMLQPWLIFLICNTDMAAHMVRHKPKIWRSLNFFRHLPNNVTISPVFSSLAFSSIVPQNSFYLLSRISYCSKNLHNFLGGRLQPAEDCQAGKLTGGERIWTRDLYFQKPRSYLLGHSRLPPIPLRSWSQISSNAANQFNIDFGWDIEISVLVRGPVGIDNFTDHGW